MDIWNIVVAGFWWLVACVLLACERDVSIIRIYPGHFSWETITTPLKLRITAASAPLPVPYPATGRHKDMWKGEEGEGGVSLMRYLGGGVEIECVGSFSGLNILLNNQFKEKCKKSSIRVH